MALAPSPSIYPSSFSLVGTPTSAKPRRSKRAPSLVLDTDAIADVNEMTPVSGSSTKRKQVRKAPPKAGAGRGRGRGGKGDRSRDPIGSMTDKTPSAGSLGLSVAASPASINETFGGSSYQPSSSGMEPHLPDRYDEEQHREGARQTAVAQNDVQIAEQEPEHLVQPYLEQHADYLQPQASSHDDDMTESFLKALEKVGNDGVTTADPPVSAFQANLEETGFDFDVSDLGGGGQ